MKLSFQNRIFILVFIAVFLIGPGVHYNFSSLGSERLSPQDLFAQEISASALSSQSVWDQEFLTHQAVLKEKIARFEQGSLCTSLKEIDTKNLTHQQITEELRKRGFRCELRPLTATPGDPSRGYLKIDNSITHDLQDKNVAWQAICQDQADPDCVIRIKHDGFPLNKRSLPHSSKAILMDSTGDPGSYDNEAFKIGAHGQPIPKGPDPKFGLKRCPYDKDQRACTQWIDKIMEDAHPLLKDPQRTSQTW